MLYATLERVELSKSKLLVSMLVFVFIFAELNVFFPAVQAATVTLTVSSAHGSPSPSVGSHSYNSGTSVTCSVSSPVVESSTAWTCTGWTGTGSVPSSGTGTSTTFTITTASSITWNWQISGQLSNGYVTPASGTTADTFHYYVTYTDYFGGAALSAIVQTDFGSGSLAVYSGTPKTGCVLGYATTVPLGSNHWYWFRATSSSSGVTIWLPPAPYAYNGPTVTPVQRLLTVSSAHDSPNPPNGNWYYNDGYNVWATVTSPVSEGGYLWTCTGWTGTGSVPSSGSGNSVQFSITQTSSITWNWQGSILQHTLTVSSAHDSPVPSNGQHVYNDGQSVTCSVTSPVTEGSTVWTCTGWSGSGSVPSSGSGTSVSFTITQDASITWNWQGTPVQRSLIVNSAHDSPVPSTGSHTYNNGDSVICSVTSPVTEGSTIWTCTGWSGTGSVPSSGSGTSVTFTITQDSSITWNWQGAPLQRTLTVSSAHDSPNPSVGAHYYSDGSSVTCTVTSPVTESGTVWTCTSWSGAGSVPSSGSGTSVSFTITQDSSITWNWYGTHVQRALIVNSAHDSPVPGTGLHTYNDGDSVSCSVTSPVTEGSTIWTCTGWSGSGSVPSSGSGTSVLFTITQDSTITWNWQGTPVQRRLAVSSAHDSPNPGVGDHYYSDSSSVTCSVTSPVTESGTIWICIGWSGTGSVPSSGSGTTVTFTITQDSSITWTWALAYSATIVAHCNTESVDVSVGILMDNSPTGFYTPHTFTSLTGTHTFTVPNTDPQVHPFKNWNTGSASPTITVTSGGTFTAYFEKLGNLVASDVEAVQTVLEPVCGTVDLVKNKPTTFLISYSSTFHEPKSGSIRVDLQGFDYASWTFKTTFQPNGYYTLWLHNEDPTAPLFKPIGSSARCTVTLDVLNNIPESNENDNVASSQQQYQILNTKVLRVLFVRLYHDDEPSYWRITSAQANAYMASTADLLRATYPVDPSQVTFQLSPETYEVTNGLLVNTFTILMGLSLHYGWGYDKVVGVVSDWPRWKTQYSVGPGVSFPSLITNAVLVRGSAIAQGETVWPCTVSHEIGHTYGLTDDYKMVNGQAVSIFGMTCSGYWVATKRVVTSCYSFMDLADYGAVNKYWVSVNEYNTLLTKLSAADPETVLVSGLIWKNGTATLGDSHRIPDGHVDFENSCGDFYIILLDRNGNLLSRTGFNASYSLMSDPPIQVNEIGFSFNVRWMDGTAEIQLTDSLGNVLASKSVSNNSPSVHVISPSGGENITPGINYTISWSATDLDGDQLTFNILIGNGTDSTPVPIATGITQTSFTYDFRDFMGGTQYLLYVVADDGVNVGVDVSAGLFTVSGFTISIATASQMVTLGEKANYTIQVTSYGSFAGQVTLNANSIVANLSFRWIDGPTITLLPGSSTNATLEIEAINATNGGQMIILSGVSGDATATAITTLYVEEHNIAVFQATSPRIEIAEGSIVILNVTIQNIGGYQEEFNLCLYDNSNLITNSTLYLHAGGTITLTFGLGLDIGSHTLFAYVSPVQGESHTSDNTSACQIVLIAPCPFIGHGLYRRPIPL